MSSNIKQGMSGFKRVRVAVRCRPTIQREKNMQTSLLSVDPQKKFVSLRTHNARQQEFEFDAVFGAKSTQEDLFLGTGANTMVDATLDGFNATIFAYGKTGSGKTYTMEGYTYTDLKARPQHTDPDNFGLLPRCVKKLFSQIKKRTETGKSSVEYKVKCALIQIYQERIFDMLNPSANSAAKSLRRNSIKSSSYQNGKNMENRGLKLRWGGENCFYVQNLYEIEVSSTKEAMGVFNRGIKNKVMGEHNLNDASSRSHCLFVLTIDGSDKENAMTNFTSKLTLVDLAGSERAKDTGASGHTLNESIAINRSLFSLRKVIKALSNLQQGNGSNTLVPYRDSKLTSLLMHGLGGNSLTLMIACISPTDDDSPENLSTLSYAAHAKSIRLSPVVNEDRGSKLVRALRQEVAELRAQLAKAQAISASVLGNVVQNGGENFMLSGDISSNEGKNGSTNTTRTEFKLKSDLINNIELIKEMFETEQKLRKRVDEAEEKSKFSVVQNRALNKENATLRERVEMLEYMMINANFRDMKSEESDENIVVPGYGAIQTDMPPSSTSGKDIMAEMLRLRTENEELHDRLHQIGMQAQAVKNGFDHHRNTGRSGNYNGEAVDGAKSERILRSGYPQEQHYKYSNSNTNRRKKVTSNRKSHQQNSNRVSSKTQSHVPRRNNGRAIRKNNQRHGQRKPNTKITHHTLDVEQPIVGAMSLSDLKSLLRGPAGSAGGSTVGTTMKTGREPQPQPQLQQQYHHYGAAVDPLQRQSQEHASEIFGSALQNATRKNSHITSRLMTTTGQVLSNTLPETQPLGSVGTFDVNERGYSQYGQTFPTNKSDSNSLGGMPIDELAALMEKHNNNSQVKF